MPAKTEKEVTQEEIIEEKKIRVKLLKNVKYGKEVKKIGEVLEVTAEEFKEYESLHICKKAE